MSGCATSTLSLPPDLLEDCPYPERRPAVTNADLPKIVQDWKHALDLCNADKAALRALTGEP